MNTQMMIDKRYKTGEFCIISPNRTQIVAAQLADGDAVVKLFGALHAYNASLDQHFALSDEWESLLREQFAETFENPDRLWLLVKDGDRAVGLLIAAVHSDSPLFRDRCWVEVEALYVAPTHRGLACPCGTTALGQEPTAPPNPSPTRANCPHHYNPASTHELGSHHSSAAAG